jgi:hypothetical protein
MIMSEDVEGVGNLSFVITDHDGICVEGLRKTTETHNQKTDKDWADLRKNGALGEQNSRRLSASHRRVLQFVC